MFRGKRFETFLLFVAQGRERGASTRGNRADGSMENRSRPRPSPSLRLSPSSASAASFSANKLFEQRHILQPATVILVEQITDDDAAGGLVGIGADKERARVVGADGLFGQHAPDGVGAFVPRWLLIAAKTSSWRL